MSVVKPGFVPVVGYPSAKAMVADGDALYVIVAEGPMDSVWRVDLTQGIASVFHADGARMIPVVMTDAERVYFGLSNDGTKYLGTRWIDKATGAVGGSISTIWTGSRHAVPTRLALASCGVLWTEGRSIYLSQLQYADPAVLMQGKISDRTIRGLASDESSIYWADAAGFIGKIPKP